MKNLSVKLQDKLKIRKANNALRKLNTQNNLTDFSSNDYLGFSKFQVIFDNTHQYLIDNNLTQNGSTGSRLLSGNHELYNTVERMLCEFHNSDAAIIFNSGYDANIGFFSAVLNKRPNLVSSSNGEHGFRTKRIHHFYIVDTAGNVDQRPGRPLVGSCLIGTHQFSTSGFLFAQV